MAAFGAYAVLFGGGQPRMGEGCLLLLLLSLSVCGNALALETG
jgi:hypothetical protein